MMTLTGVQLPENANSASPAELTYSVRHNVGVLPTTLELAMLVKLESSMFTGTDERVTVSLDVGPITAKNLDDARLRLANWCERTAAALRYCARSPDTLLPHYTKTAFDLAQLPSWLQLEFKRISDAYCAVPYDDRAAITKQLVLEMHPLVLIPGALDEARHLADGSDPDD